MPFLSTKGDLARRPAMCAEIAALRAKRSKAQNRLFYFNTKDAPTATEVTEPGQLGWDMVY